MLKQVIILIMGIVFIISTAEADPTKSIMVGSTKYTYDPAKVMIDEDATYIPDKQETPLYNDFVALIEANKLSNQVAVKQFRDKYKLKCLDEVYNVGKERVVKLRKGDFSCTVYTLPDLDEDGVQQVADNPVLKLGIEDGRVIAYSNIYYEGFRPDLKIKYANCPDDMNLETKVERFAEEINTGMICFPKNTSKAQIKYWRVNWFGWTWSN